jgi:hypothetical protein
LTPARILWVNNMFKSAAPSMGFKVLRSLSDVRWEATRDGVHVPITNLVPWGVSERRQRLGFVWRRCESKSAGVVELNFNR